MPGKRPVRRPIHVGFRLTRAEKAQVRKCAQKGEVFSETCRRLLLVGVASAATVYVSTKPVTAADLLERYPRYVPPTPDPE